MKVHACVAAVIVVASLAVSVAAATAKARPFSASGILECTTMGAVSFHPGLSTATPAPTTETIKATLACSIGTTGAAGVTVTGAKLVAKSQAFTADCQGGISGPVTGTATWKATGGKVATTHLRWSGSTLGSTSAGTSLQLRTGTATGSYADNVSALLLNGSASTLCTKHGSQGFHFDDPGGFQAEPQSLWSWGDGSTAPVLVGTDSDWAQVSRGSDNQYFDKATEAIKTDGSLWGWGDNSHGELGDGSTDPQPTPEQITGDDDWSQVSTDGDHTVAIKTDGTLWAWGDNAFGQLGDGGTTGQLSPEEISADPGWAQISTAGNDTMAIKDDGTLWAWGENLLGELGDGTTIERTSPEQIGTADDWAQISTTYQSLIFGLYNFVTVATRTDGTMWAWGSNSQGQLGDGTTTWRTSPEQIGSGTKWTQASTAPDHTLAIASDGTLWAWGADTVGQLGNGSQGGLIQMTPAEVSSNPGWAQVSTAQGESDAIKSDGTRWAWGDNAYGDLGDGTTTEQDSPEQVGPDTDWTDVIANGDPVVMGLRSGPVIQIDSVTYPSTSGNEYVVVQGTGFTDGGPYWVGVNPLENELAYCGGPGQGGWCALRPNAAADGTFTITITLANVSGGCPPDIRADATDLTPNIGSNEVRSGPGFCIT